MLTRQSLEKYQVIIYLAAIGCGLVVGRLSPDNISFLEVLLWPLLGVLLYTTFIQVPLVHLREALIDSRFVAAAVIGNFILLPVVVSGLLMLVTEEPAIRLGVLLVLLMPCTDWFITFTHLGGGDTKLAIAFSPISLLLQIILLPVYLWVFLGENFVITLAQNQMLTAFAGLILLPLFGAYLTEKWVERNKDRRYLLDQLVWLPMPLLALVVFFIAATQVGLIIGSTYFLGQLLLVFIVFLIMAGLIAYLLARQFALSPEQGRVLAFSFGTRNSFVMLPLALALPSSFELAVVVIVFQSLVELLGMAFYLWWVPKQLFPIPT
ncbi:arsenic resistance protein [Nitrosomonas sp. Nm33]|uniref:arsenic resistance protein n=1 Tax=Nitrosomonas sp. Nm33 TaxID=133724 RepID=UPI00089790DF|nr:bile acid:sodium symporter [Nitrosomonas sp. Nm33]SDY54120.1 Arsenite efflux pump ArsB, ACR3 family [Nitrosomonas sp. Nm33]